MEKRVFSHADYLRGPYAKTCENRFLHTGLLRNHMNKLRSIFTYVTSYGPLGTYRAPRT